MTGLRGAARGRRGSTKPAVSIRLLDPGWLALLPDARARVRRAARAALEGAAAPSRSPGPCIVLADDATLRRLNRTYRNLDKPTNVLSFPADGPAPDAAGLPLGDVVLARETIVREAAAQGKAPGDHVVHLVVHGVLHLLGYDHEAEGAARAMERLEVAVLARLGIADPYRPAGAAED